MKITQKELECIIREEIYNESDLNALNEGFKSGFVDILKGLSAGITDKFKEEVAQELLIFLGIDPPGPVGVVFINFVGNLSYEDLAAMITGSNKCEALVSELGDALAETVIEGIPVALQVAPKGRIAKVLQESLSKALTEDLSDDIAKALCEIDFLPLIDSLPGGKMLRKLFFKE